MIGIHGSQKMIPADFVDLCALHHPLVNPPHEKHFDAWMFENEPLYFKLKVHLVNIL